MSNKIDEGDRVECFHIHLSFFFFCVRVFLENKDQEDKEGQRYFFSFACFRAFERKEYAKMKVWCHKGKQRCAVFKVCTDSLSSYPVIDQQICLPVQMLIWLIIHEHNTV